MTLWKTIKKLLLLVLFVSLNSFAFQKGDGSEFVMMTEGQKVSLSIYITKVETKKMGVEFHFGAGDIFMSNMWQQFEMDVSNGRSVEVKKGYIKAGVNKKTEIMGREHFEINKGEGVELQDFLFADPKDLEKDFVGSETVELPAGSIVAKHYRKTKAGQTVDFWIASEVKPIGLVKLVSKSDKKKTNNYSIELSSLLKNVKPAIDPKEAVPMSKETKEMFNKKKD